MVILGILWIDIILHKGYYGRSGFNTIKDNGHYIFLWTVRGDESWDSEGKINALQNAREFLDENEIEIDGFNSSPIHPSSSPKQHCDYFIDDIK